MFKGIFSISLFSIIVFTPKRLLAQSESLQQVKKGESVPDLAFQIKRGDSTYEAHLSDFQGKAIILDIWGVYCYPCITDIPRLDSLQQAFKGEVEILMLCDHNDEMVDQKFNELGSKSSFNQIMAASARMSFMRNASAFQQLFPHPGQPTHVWIDSNRIFRYMTDGGATQDSDIHRFLEGGAPAAMDIDNRPMDIFNPFQWYAPPWRGSLGMYSLFTGYAGGYEMQYGEIEDSVTKTTVGYHFLNTPLQFLYFWSYRKWLASVNPWENALTKSRIICSKKIEAKLFPVTHYPLSLEFSKKNLYCLAIKDTSVETSRLDRRMRQQLDDALGWRSRVENRQVMTWVLRSTSKRKPVNRSDESDLSTAIASTIYPMLSRLEQSLPFADESNLLANTKLYGIPPYDANLSLLQVKQILQENGLELIQASRKQSMLVIEQVK